MASVPKLVPFLAPPEAREYRHVFYVLERNGYGGLIARFDLYGLPSVLSMDFTQFRVLDDVCGRHVDVLECRAMSCAEGVKSILTVDLNPNYVYGVEMFSNGIVTNDQGCRMCERIIDHLKHECMRLEISGTDAMQG